jgi:hypothetical protein
MAASRLNLDRGTGNFLEPIGWKACATLRGCGLQLVFLLLLCFSSSAAETIDLSGRWELQLDSQDQDTVSNFVAKPFTDFIQLPGTISQTRKGTPLGMEPVLPTPASENLNPKRGLSFGRDKSVLESSPLAHLYQRFSYVGPAWYRRTFDIPKTWTNKDVQLVLERVIWESRVWVNGQFVGARNSLTTPHGYEIGVALNPGRNELLVRIDNRRQMEIGNPHAYTDESQSIWNGIIGRIALEARDKVRIDNLELRPDLERRGVEVTAQTHNGTGREFTAELSLQTKPENFRGARPAPAKSVVSLPVGDSKQKIFYPMGTNFELWSEFNPRLYRLEASLSGDDIHSGASSTFGMREFKAERQSFMINGRPVFLRGTVNCCEFPRTGYPDMTGEQWEKIFSTVKACGLNHVRFHTWCPPEAGFEMADRYGVYLEVELPNWCFKIGQDTNVTEFFRTEGERMIREYGNHPSWVMFTMGNELKGDYSVLDGLENHFRKLDPQLLYDSTTYPSSTRGKIPEPADDYYISQDTAAGRARGQGIFENTQPNTDANFAEAISPIHIPFISHEVGQYCVYPNLAEIPKYEGVLRAVNFEAIRNDLPSKRRLDEAGTYTRDSGNLAALLYKEEIERALRTPNQAGFELLELNDFPGQGTSTVGLFDTFWDSKRLISSEEFRSFCAPVVPLLLMPKRVYQNTEAFDAGVEVANFGPAPIENKMLAWEVTDGNEEIAAGSFKVPLMALGRGHELGRIRQAFSVVGKAAKLKVTLQIPGTGIKNDWFIWVYPASASSASTNNIAIFETETESFYQALGDGKRVLLLPSRESVASPLAAQFTPVFWNPVMFPNQPGSMGAMIDARLPVFAEFPTDPWTNWQWWDLLHDSYAINLNTIQEQVSTPLRFVDRFDRNAQPTAIFEARVGAGRLLVCTLDINSDPEERIAARQLRRSILDYMSSNRFRPGHELKLQSLEKMFRAP